MKNFNTLKPEGKSDIISIIIEELQHNSLLEESIKDRYGDLNELHFKCFNEDYFMVGYYESEKWLKKNWEYGIFDAIQTVKEYEEDNFGDFKTEVNSECICNMLTYIIGEEIIYSLDEDKPVKDIINELEELK